jgi:hypothetical protein
MSMKNSNVSIRIRTSDLPAYSTENTVDDIKWHDVEAICKEQVILAAQT